MDSTICDFSAGCQGWVNVDDVVMGGVSHSMMQHRLDGTASFTGELSLERNGGFASVRTLLNVRDFRKFERFRLRLKGDGKHYSFRVRNDERFDGVVYASDFDTQPGEWMEIDLPFSDFRPLFRGRARPEAPAMDPARVVQIGFLISSKQEGPFCLQVEWIKAV
jgi:NADH dehydrogenase [ubiquinone] 1 alpha subcomplex assembly factor 1